MNEQNIALFEAFKRLDGLCRDIYQSEKGVTEYITDMETRRGATFRIPNWSEDLERLKHLRHIRNYLAHEISSFDEELCTAADVQWLQEFYQRILNGSDPISQLAQYERNQHKIKPSEKEHPVSQQTAHKEQGCYIATCVYGSYDCPPVWTLRRYRDQKLAATWYGRVFIQFYYAVSPTLVKYIGQVRFVRAVWKKVLDKMVAKLKTEGYENSPYYDQR